MLKTYSLRSLAALLISLSSIAMANASFTQYSSENAFAGALGSSGLDTFDDLPASTSLLVDSISLAAGSFTYTAASTESPLYSYGSGTDRWLATQVDISTLVFSSFSAQANAVGGYFFANDFFDASYLGNATVTVTDINNVSETVTLNNTTAGTYLGFTSTVAIQTLSVSAVNYDSDGFFWPTANNLTVGIAAVPEPATYAMLLAGLGMLGFVARRRS